MKIGEIMEPNVATVVERDSVSLAMQIMLQREIRHLPVLRQGEVVGVISQSDLLANASDIADPENSQATVGELMSSPAQTIASHAPLGDAAAKMAVHKLGCLPVEDAGTLVGIVTTTDLLSGIAQSPVPDPAAPSVETIMSTNVHAVMADGLLLDAVATMVRRGVRHLVVIDGLQRVVGMVSDRDILSTVGPPANLLEDAELPDAVDEMRIAAVMTPEPRTIRADATLDALSDALLADRIGALPVVDQADQLVGIVSYIDVLNRLRRRKKG